VWHGPQQGNVGRSAGAAKIARVEWMLITVGWLVVTAVGGVIADMVIRRREARELRDRRRRAGLNPRCARCGYCVRGVREWRCPECGVSLRGEH
jgi:tRNA(Ile2) C34 agmatinyltransferase TiaS